MCARARKHTTRNRATLHTSSYTWLFVTHNRATLHPSSNTWLFVTHNRATLHPALTHGCLLRTTAPLSIPALTHGCLLRGRHGWLTDQKRLASQSQIINKMAPKSGCEMCFDCGGGGGGGAKHVSNPGSKQITGPDFIYDYHDCLDVHRRQDEHSLRPHNRGRPQQTRQGRRAVRGRWYPAGMDDPNRDHCCVTAASSSCYQGGRCQARLPGRSPCWHGPYHGPRDEEPQ